MISVKVNKADRADIYLQVAAEIRRAISGATSVVGNAISEDDERRKLRTIAETARVVWG